MELYFVYASALMIVGLFAFQAITRRFDPFAPVWMFLVGFTQVYVIQPISYHEWAIRSRGIDLVTTANSRAFWALALYLVVYYFGPGRRWAVRLPSPPARWSAGLVTLISPLLIAWGLVCAGLVLRANGDEVSAEASLMRSFPFVMLVAGVLLIITARSGPTPRPFSLMIGMATCGLYVLIWMFNGKRSHSLIGVLACACAFYVSKRTRPSWPILLTTAFLGVLAVGIAIGWRKDMMHERSISGFTSFLTNFEVSTVLESLNLDDPEQGRRESYETEEYGGYLVMLTAVPNLSDYDYGSNYLRVFSTYIPRIVWPNKPVFGRDEWINAWIAGSEFKRDSKFTGPAIGILGATQLNGGAWGTAIVFTCIATLHSLSYGYFRRYCDFPWVQAWWSITYYNAWFMVVNDDPLVWFYYNWGFTTLPILTLCWFANRKGDASQLYSPLHGQAYAA
jgi:hypothetical protein